jgi:hypothetical protein
MERPGPWLMMPALKRTIEIEFFPATLKRWFPLLQQRAPTGFPLKPARRIDAFPYPL